MATALNIIHEYEKCAQRVILWIIPLDYSQIECFYLNC